MYLSKISIDLELFVFFGTHDASLLILSDSSLEKIGFSLKGNHFHPIKRIFALVNLRTTQSTN